VRKALPGVFLRTTLMTGFPGETEDDFRMLLDFIEEACIDHLGVFAFSREEGTAAGRMEGQIGSHSARERADTLLLRQAGISSGILSRFIGQEMKVLAEGCDEDGPYGRHQGQAPEVDGVVRLDRETAPGAFVRVRITGNGAYDLEGKIITQESGSRSQYPEEEKT
jgi:ribosomal protein S12 methylthiotransferase